ncbi:protein DETOXIFICATION 43-like [Eucalyptus grandis]|uniref:protein DETOXIFICATION 43-like n=1 Tax=Eucalyptus grandis TaxID=71139 RepID=UPI00192E8717|nr:protein DETOXIFICATION 43-like [Eucalyptus grandis]
MPDPGAESVGHLSPVTEDSDVDNQGMPDPGAESVGHLSPVTEDSDVDNQGMPDPGAESVGHLSPVTEEGAGGNDPQHLSPITEDSDVDIQGMPEDASGRDPRAESDQLPLPSKWHLPIAVFFGNLRQVFSLDELAREILGIAFPAILTLAANFATSLIHSAFLRHLGPIELAAVGFSIAGFNQLMNVFMFALTIITTSVVAKENTLGKTSANLGEVERLDSLERGSDANLSVKIGQGLFHKRSQPAFKERGPHSTSGAGSLELRVGKTCDDLAEDDNVEIKEPTPDDEVVPAEARTRSKERQRIPSASSALVVAGILGVLLAFCLRSGAEALLRFMGIKPGSLSLTSATRYLKLRSLAAPAVLLSFVIQGVFLGLKDAKTPLYATVAGELANIGLDPVLTFVFHLGVGWVAVAHIVSQYMIFLILLWRLIKRVYILPPSLKAMRFRQFIKNGLLLVVWAMALTSGSSLAYGLAARLGSGPLEALLICLKLWTTPTIIAGGLAAAGQAILAGAFAEKDYDKAIATTSRVLQMGLIIGLGLTVIIGVGLSLGSGVLSRDVNVQHLISLGIPFIAAAQLVNCLLVVFDGLNFGLSDFTYSTYSMVLISMISLALLFLLSEGYGFIGIWIALSISLGLRIVACIWRMGSKNGPWRFLGEGLLPRRF